MEEVRTLTEQLAKVASERAFLFDDPDSFRGGVSEAIRLLLTWSEDEMAGDRRALPA